MSNADLDGLFRQAVAAIDAGDVPALERLLEAHPELVRERLTAPGEWLRSQIGGALDGFFKDPYLLWFVTEDAVRTGQLSASVSAVAANTPVSQVRKRLADSCCATSSFSSRT